MYVRDKNVLRSLQSKRFGRSRSQDNIQTLQLSTDNSRIHNAGKQILTSISLFKYLYEISSLRIKYIERVPLRE